MHRALRSMAVAALLAATLAACGGDDADPTAVPTLAPPTATSAAAAVGSPAASSPAASPIASPVDPATLQPGEVTFGQLADRIAAAWPGVTSYRSETVTLLADGSPVPNAAAATREVLLPDRKRFLAVSGDTTTEILFVADALFTRTGDGPWGAVDAARLDDADPLRNAYAELTQPASPPYAGVSARDRDRVGRESGVVDEGGRACTAYLFPDVGSAGERIETTVLLDAAGLPCRIETLAGSTRTRTTFAYNLPLAIDAPAGVPASPIASPIPVEQHQHET